MAPAASDIAADLVATHLPALATRLRKYDEEIFEFQLRHDDLEEEITRMRRSVAHKQAQQVRFLEQLSYKEVSKASLKRQRTEDDPNLEEARMMRPRLEPSERDAENYNDNQSDSEMVVAVQRRSKNMERRGRFFSNEELRPATANTNM
ncbi:hypothetical protein B0H12DRAFT_1231623 [Mycena haematopus]|nr:hypothetical protein B0H12DRAFT_1231623 [Mycena haematopus]